MRIDYFYAFFFRKYVLPEGLAKEPPKMLKIHKRLDPVDCTMTLIISTCKFDANATTDAFKHIPEKRV